jgi:hypothetical protein
LVTFSTEPALARTIAECDADYAANKAAVKASGQTRKDIWQPAAREPLLRPQRRPPAAPEPATASPSTFDRTPAQRNAEYAVKKALLKAAAQSKKEFLAACPFGCR